MKVWIESEEFEDKSIQIHREDMWNKRDLAEVRGTGKYKEFYEKEDLRTFLEKPKVPFNIPLSYRMSDREAKAFRNGFARGFVRRNKELLALLQPSFPVKPVEKKRLRKKTNPIKDALIMQGAPTYNALKEVGR